MSELVEIVYLTGTEWNFPNYSLSYLPGHTKLWASDCPRFVNDMIHSRNYIVVKFNRDGIRYIKLIEGDWSRVKRINFSRNYIKDFPFHKLPFNMIEINVAHNQIPFIMSLPSGLKYFKATENPIRHFVDDLPPELEILIVKRCGINYLPNVPSTMRVLLICNNNIPFIPITLMLCNRLIDLDYSDNPNIIIEDDILKFIDERFHGRRDEYNRINRLRRANDIIREERARQNNMLGIGGSDDQGPNTIYDDAQNVHDHKITEDVQKSIERLLEINTDLDIELAIEEFSQYITIPGLTVFLKELCKNDAIHSLVGCTFCDLFIKVWHIIRNNKDEDEKISIINILVREIEDMRSLCFSGRLTNLVNSLSGFSSLVNIKITDDQQIQAKYNVVKTELKDHFKFKQDTKEYYIEFKKRFLELIEELNLDAEKIAEWTKSFDEIINEYDDIYQNTNQATDQITDQTTNQTTDQTTNQPTDQITDQTTNQTTDQTTNQTTNQTNNQYNDVDIIYYTYDDY